MIYSIIFGFLLASTIWISGWLRLLISFVSISMGSRIPFLYVFLGFQLGMGNNYKLDISFWPSFLTGFLLAIFIAIVAAKYSEKQVGVIQLYLLVQVVLLLGVF
jgi:hypothetical protein